MSLEYGFSIDFPQEPEQHSLKNIKNSIFLVCSTPDIITYSFFAQELVPEADVNETANDFIDDVGRTKEWRVYSERESVVYNDRQMLTQTFIAEDGTFLANATLFSNKCMFNIQVMNVLEEHIDKKFKKFLDTLILSSDN